MDLNTHLMALLAPIAIGTEVLPGVIFEDTSVELGLRLRFGVGGERLWVDVGPVDRVRRFAARSDLLGFGYRTEGGRSAIDPKLGLKLCEAIAQAVRENERDVLQRASAAARAEADPTARIRHVEVNRALDASGLGGSGYYTLNPYVGCVIGCRFCYAQSPLATMRWLIGLAELDWGAYVEVRTNLHEVLAKELDTLEPLPIKFCPIVGDAYQGTEKRERVTRRCLEVIAASRHRWPPMILTRSMLLQRDIGLLAQIEGAWAGVSLPTVDDVVRRHFEPRAASVGDRLRLLQLLRGEGVATFAVVQPMMAGNAEQLADALSRDVDAVIVDPLQDEEGATLDFDDPRYRATRTQSWQQDRVHLLLDLLRDRGVAVWAQELPPEYCAPGTVTLR